MAHCPAFYSKSLQSLGAWRGKTPPALADQLHVTNKHQQRLQQTADVQVEKFSRNKSKDAAVISSSAAESGPEPNQNQSKASTLHPQQPNVEPGRQSEGLCLDVAQCRRQQQNTFGSANQGLSDASNTWRLTPAMLS